jgi:hypothetical protein
LLPEYLDDFVAEENQTPATRTSPAPSCRSGWSRSRRASGRLAPRRARQHPRPAQGTRALASMQILAPKQRLPIDPLVQLEWQRARGGSLNGRASKTAHQDRRPALVRRKLREIGAWYALFFELDCRKHFAARLGSLPNAGPAFPVAAHHQCSMEMQPCPCHLRPVIWLPR